MSEFLERINRLNEIGVALSAERDIRKLLEIIVMGAKALTCADGGSLYFLKDDILSFEIISNDSLDLQMGGTSGNRITFPPIPLTLAGVENHRNVVSHCVLSDNTINIDDAYNEDGFDFSGTREFDAKTGYRTRSILTFPLKDHEKRIIGVLQLINARSRDTGEVISFGTVEQRLAESLASQAAVALTQRRLITELQALFEAFIKMIASAIDEKSPYTGGHCRRIPVLVMALAEAVNRTESGPLKDFQIDDRGRYELETAAWLHDCGKVITPEHIMDKATKLSTIFDRIELLAARVEVILRDLEIDYLRRLLEAGETADRQALRREYESGCRQLKDDLAFLRVVNIGGEDLSDADIYRVGEIANREWRDHSGEMRPLITGEELKNLCIKRGTLNADEREAINNHIVTTINMLESLPFPRHLANVPEFAGGHHEKMDGSGYPRGLKREEMSVQARIMAIADIFEALTARDRPYKAGKPLSECLRIMGQMKLDQHIDPDLFDIFIENRIYLDYAEEFLDPEQIDQVNETSIPGYCGKVA